MERQPSNLMLFYEMAALLRYIVDREELDGETSHHAKALLARFEEAHR